MSRSQVLINDQMAFDSWATTDNSVTLISPVLTEALNKHAALTFSIPLTHPLAAAIIPLITTVTAIRDDKAAFYGRVRRISRNIWGTADVVCEGPTAHLSDTIQPPWKWTGPVSGLLNYFINRHNNTTTGPTWTLGNVTAVDPNQSITRWSTEWLTTWEALTSRFPDSALGGYLLARRGTGNTMILDYVATPGPLSGQTLNIGENIIDINQILDATQVATRVIPLGALLEEDEDTTTGNGLLPSSRVGIESVNSGVSWVEDTDLVNTLGSITATHVWDDITQPSTLLTRGYEELARRKVAALSIDVDALDLSTLNVNTDALSLGSTVRIIATHLGINQQAIIQEIEIPLAEPGLKVHIGAETTSFIKQTLEAQKASADKITAVQSSNAKLNEAVTEVRIDLVTTSATAQSAQSGADAAAQAAAAAAGIASGKPDILIQASTPADSYRRSNTLWIDTTGGQNTPKRWSGSAWVPVTDKAATDAAAAAAGAQSTATAANAAAGAAQSTATSAQSAASAAASAASAAQSTANTAVSNASSAAASATAAQAAADKAWNAAQQNNLIRDGVFATTSATDNLTLSGTSTATANATATQFTFKATGYTGLLPSPATTYGRTITTNEPIARGVNGAADGLPCVPGRIYRLRIMAAYTGNNPGTTSTGFRHWISRRVSGTWSNQGSVGDTLQPIDVTQQDPSFRQLDFLWTAPANCDRFRAGFGRTVTTPTPVAEWFVTNWSVTDVTEAVAAQAQADAASSAAENARVAAEIAQSDAATAQARADAATADAAAAQSTADSAQSAAAEAQSSADAAAQAAADVGAQAAAELAQTTLELQSQINQTAAQISAEISQIYTSKTSTTEQIAALKSYLELNAAGLYLTLSQMNSIRTAIDSDIDGVADSIMTLQTLIWADTAGIHIGRSSDPVTMLLTNGALNFYLNGNRIAWFDGAAQQLKIDNARITTSLVIGDGMWVPESSSPLGGMSLVEAI